jgi:glycosyltransferase involved in cell wall biosynthesis
MKVALIHNYYQQPGGEDVVFHAESDLLASRGHTVVRYTVDNRSIEGMGRLALATAAVWNRASYRQLRELFRTERPDVAHFHNTFPLVSPAGYYAARAEGVGVVQTLHNFRLVCPNGLLFRDGHVCEDCLGKFFPWPGIVHACYHKSRPATAVMAGMLTLHKPVSTWNRIVGVYIALSEFSRQKFIAGGLPPGKIVVKPNFLRSDPGIGLHLGGYALFVGRLSPEKGVETIIDAWKMIKDPVPLKIVGGGPLEDQLRVRTAGGTRMELLGTQPASCVRELMQDAWVLIVPSYWYEGGLPLVVLEAFAAGLPVVASDSGNLSALIDHERTGLLFRPGDPADLGQKLAWAASHPEAMVAIRQRARRCYEERYTASANYGLLMDIYAAAALLR